MILNAASMSFGVPERISSATLVLKSGLLASSVFGRSPTCIRRIPPTLLRSTPPISIAAARRANGPDGPRHHVGHNTFVHPDDRSRARDLKVVLEVSPANTWYPSSYSPSFISLLGAERVGSMVPVGELTQNGGRVVYGSDWDNVPEPDPWLALETLVTRVNPEEPALGVLAPDQRVDLATAIEILTINGAHTLGLEARTGSIEVGKDADLIVLEHDLFAVPVEKIHETVVRRTVLRGETVYRR